LTESQYKRLCRLCNNIVLKKNIHFVPWLNIIREHPEFLKNYENIFQKKNTFIYLWRLQFNKFKYFAWWAIHIVSCIYLKKENINLANKNKINKLDYLFISHRLVDDFSDSDNDFYFGSVPDEMNRSGFKVKVIAINHTPKNKDKKVSNLYELLDKKTNFLTEISIHNKLKKQSKRLKKILHSSKDILAKKVLRKSIIETMAPNSHFVGRMEVHIKRYVQQYRPDILISTFEGHSWERIAFSTAKKINPEITCIGYQHSHLFRLQNGIRLMKDKNLNPDIIFTSGKNGKNQCEKIFQNLPILDVGTKRALVSNVSVTNKLAKKSEICLVVPEGISDECIRMFDYSILCAKANPSVQFVFRLHPVISLNDLLSKNNIYSKMPSNIIFSRNSLIEDAKKSKWALYRGSASIIEICKEGVVPIYIEFDSELSIDPLFNVNHIKFNVSKIDDFSNIILLNNKKNIKKISEYCDTLFSKLNVSKFKKNSINEILRNYD
jgi:hypothetical protein